MKIETLSPVHIGTGYFLTSADFTIKDNKVIVVDLPKVFEYLEKRRVKIDELINKFSSATGFLLDELFKDYNLNPSDFKKYEIELIGEKGKESMRILEQIKIGLKPYIPGTSIKGSIRTALLWKVVKENPKLLNHAINSLKRKLARGKLSRKALRSVDDELERKVFGATPHEDILRALKVIDSKPFDKMVVYRVNIIGNPEDIPAFVEAIPENTTTEFYMDIDSKILRDMTFKGELSELDMNLIISALGEFAKEVIEVELQYDWQNNETLEFYDKLRKLAEKKILIRVGWGSGWYSTTIGTLLKTHPEFEGLRVKLGLGRNPKTGEIVKTFPKTRRITANGLPLGWVRVVV